MNGTVAASIIFASPADPVALDLGPGMERGRASQVSTGVSSRPPHSVQEPS